jgi:penicillin-binding protein
MAQGGQPMHKVFKLLLCGVILAALLCACSGGGNTANDISQYLSAFTGMDYAAMFDCTEAALDNTGDALKAAKTAFVDKYTAIFTGIGVTGIELSNLAGPDDNGVYTYTATYKTKDYGDFTNNFTLKSRTEEGKCYVMWDCSLIFPEMEQGCSVLVSTEQAKRGEIFAADGTLLAANSYADTVYMDVSKVQDIAAVSRVASPLTGLSEEEIVNKFNSAVENEYTAVSLGVFAPGALTEEQRAAIEAVPGLGIDDAMYTPIRSYSMGDAAAHIVGYTQYVSEVDLDEGYDASDRKGVVGLEAAYEDKLRGTDGKIVYIQNKWGENIRTLWEQPKQEGQDLRTSIIPRLQKEAYAALSENLSVAEGESGVAIVMDATTGEVQAMACFPSFDDNLFTFPISTEQMNFWNDKANGQPLFARATQGRYPPGSVIKPFTAAAALEAGTVTPDTVFTGTIIDNKWTPDEEGWMWKPITRVSDSGTPLKMLNALTESDNIYFAWLAMQMGEDTYLNYLSRIGFEEAVPFDLTVKSANLVDSTMYRRLLADMGYGQGELLVAPIQVAAMYTAFANGTGSMMQPVLVDRLCQTQGLDYVTTWQSEPTVWIENAVSQSSLNTLEPMLEAVMSDGTGKPARIGGITLAGKTGTAEIGEDKSREISWFACYWVDGSYKRLVVVMVDVATDMGGVKFDIAKRLLIP